MKRQEQVTHVPFRRRMVRQWWLYSDLDRPGCKWSICQDMWLVTGPWLCSFIACELKAASFEIKAWAPFRALVDSRGCCKLPSAPQTALVDSRGCCKLPSVPQTAFVDSKGCCRLAWAPQTAFVDSRGCCRLPGAPQATYKALRDQREAGHWKGSLF